MKIILIFLVLSFFPHESKASGLMLDYYCGCRGTLELMPGTAKIILKESAEFKPCSDAFYSIEQDQELELLGIYDQRFDAVTRKKDNDGKPICNNTEIKDYLAQYKKLQSKNEALLEEKVELDLCRSDLDNKGKRREINECREALVDLLGEHEKVLYDECKEDFKNRGKSKQINKCVRIQAYELLLNTSEAKFFEDVCPKTGMEECVQDIRLKLADTYFKQEVATCNKEHGFNTPESVSVCKDVLISKILAFSTNEERNKLLDCIRKVNSSDQSGINSCVSKYLMPNDTDEKDKLTQLKDSFCPLDQFENDAKKQNKCLEDLLLENLQDLPLSKECQEKPDAVSRKKCQRMELYDKLMASKNLDVFDCWNRKKFESMKERANCHDLSQESQAQISRCLEMGDLDAKIQCLEKTGKNGKSLNGFNIADEEAARALEKLLKELSIDTSQCTTSKTSKTECLKGLYDEFKAQQEAAGGAGIPAGQLPGAEESNTKAPALHAEGKEGAGTNAALSGRTSKVSGQVSDKSHGGSAAAAGLVGVAATTALNTSGVKVSPVITGVFTMGLVPLIKNLKRSIKYRKSKNGSCRCLSKVGTLTVFDRIRQFVSTKNITKKLDPTKLNGQEDGVAKVESLNNNHAKNFSTSVQTSQVKKSQSAQCQALAAEEHQQAVASNQPPPTCGDGKTASTDLSRPKLFMEQINEARNSYHAQLIFNEWNAFAAGDIVSMNIDAIDLELLSVVKPGFEEKESMISTIIFTSFLISPAFAEGEGKEKQQMGSALNIAMEMVTMSGVDQKEVASTINKGNPSDPLVESSDAQKEAAQEKREYTSMVLKFTSEANAMKKVNEQMIEEKD